MVQSMQSSSSPVQDLLAEVQRGWEPIRAAVEAIGEEGLDGTTRSGWTVKEMIAHLAFWEETVVAMVYHFRGKDNELPEDWYGGDELGVASGVASQGTLS